MFIFNKYTFPRCFYAVFDTFPRRFCHKTYTFPRDFLAAKIVKISIAEKYKALFGL